MLKHKQNHYRSFTMFCFFCVALEQNNIKAPPIRIKINKLN